MEPVGQTRDGKTTLRVHLQPRSSKNRICGLHDAALKLAVTAPPVDGKANKEVCGFLADLFGVSRKDIALVSGMQSRRKVFCFATLSKEYVCERLQALLD